MPRFSRWLLAAALAFPSFAAYGQESGGQFKCGPVIEFMRILRQVQAVPGVKVEQIEAAEAKAFMDMFNAQEPVTEYSADIVVFVIGPEVGTVTFVSGDKACILLQPQPFPAEALRGMLLYVRQKVGTPA
jgi:hypothetical protein